MLTAIRYLLALIATYVAVTVGVFLLYYGTPEAFFGFLGLLSIVYVGGKVLA